MTTIKLIKSTEVRFDDLRPGYFLFGGSLCLKTEYADEAFCESGEAFWGGTFNRADRGQLEVTPVAVVVEAP